MIPPSATIYGKLRFFFVVYQDTEDKGFVLKGCQFWNIPYDDLEGNVREVWQETHDMIARGLKFEYKAMAPTPVSFQSKRTIP